MMCMLALLAAAGMAAAQSGPPFQPAAWRLDFLDDFEGTELNASVWNPKTGTHTSQEGEWYLPENVAVSNGHLVLTAKLSADPSKTGGLKYTSGWVDTQNKVFATGGRFEAACKYYVGAGGRSLGYWPAYWLMPQGGACWPVSGEIDVMESLGGAAKPYGGSAVGEQESHWDLHFSPSGACDDDGSVGNFTPPLSLNRPSGLYNESFAVFGVNYDVGRDETTFYVNGTVVGQHAGFSKLVDKVHPWYHILNYAVGGPWGGFPDDSTVFPTTMECDWVRHFAPA